MKKRTQFCVWLLSLCITCAYGQIGAPAVPATGTQASQLPLSGRTGSSGSVVATQSPVAGTTTSVNTINPAIQAQGPYAGSALSTAKRPFSGKLSLQEAVSRGLEYNLGTVGLTLAMQQAHGQAIVSRSALLPNLNGTLSETVQQTNLRAEGLRFSSPIPGFGIPSIVGPFNYFDLRAHLTQTVADFAALNNYRSTKETVPPRERSSSSGMDAEDLVVLAGRRFYLPG